VFSSSYLRQMAVLRHLPVPYLWRGYHQQSVECACVQFLLPPQDGSVERCPTGGGGGDDHQQSVERARAFLVPFSAVRWQRCCTFKISNMWARGRSFVTIFLLPKKLWDYRYYISESAVATAWDERRSWKIFSGLIKSACL
jgi:hypothetical protein